MLPNLERHRVFWGRLSQNGNRHVRRTYRHQSLTLYSAALCKRCVLDQTRGDAELGIAQLVTLTRVIRHLQRSCLLQLPSANLPPRDALPAQTVFTPSPWAGSICSSARAWPPEEGGMARWDGRGRSLFFASFSLISFFLFLFPFFPSFLF